MAPWIMTQRWNDLLFLHYALPPEVLRPLVPDVLTLDTYKQRAWISVTPFWINHLRPPGVPSLPWFSHFAEVNVRTYVTLRRQAGGVFLQPRRQQSVGGVGRARVLSAAVLAGCHEAQGKGGPKIEYVCKRQHGPKPAELRCSYGPDSPMFQAHPGSLEHFLSERYCLYA